MTAELHELKEKKNLGKAASLLHSLVPRAQVFCFYDEKRECVWSSDGAEDYEIDNFVAELPDDLVDKLDSQDEVLRRTSVFSLPCFRRMPASRHRLTRVS